MHSATHVNKLKQFTLYCSFHVPDVNKACERFEKLGVEFVKKPDAGTMKGLAFIKVMCWASALLHRCHGIVRLLQTTTVGCRTRMVTGLKF